jgi:hypothetical protein
MHKKRNRFVLSIAVTLALLAGLLPMTFSAAMENTQAGDLQCPPVDASMLKVPGYLKSLPAECRGLKTSAPAPFAQSMSALLATGGPDDFGYTFNDNTTFHWFDTTTDTGLSGDENATVVDLDFNFAFYGLNYSQVYIHTNGFLSFDFLPGCCFFEPSRIPRPAQPNNYIAPFWDDLVVGAPDNSGGVFLERGGVEPARYLVVEWRDVTTYFGSDPFTFQVILFEGGNITVQLQSLPGSYYSTVGIENSLGDDGLEYHFANAGLSVPKVVQFYYPFEPTPRVSVSPRRTGKFAGTAANTNFPIHLTNIGTAGTDAYNLFVSSAWAANLYQDGCVTPLTDTNGDSTIDTGPLAQGASMTICVSFTTPPGATVGDNNPAIMIVSSTIDSTRAKDVFLSMTVSAPFVQVLEDYVNAANAFQINGPQGPTTNYVTDDFYFANGLATMRLPDGRYVYVWRKPDGNYPDSHSNIEFTLLNGDGSFSLPVTEITNNSGTGQTYDYDPAVAVAPNGNIGVTWYRWIVDNSTGLFNYNMYFAMLSDEGAILYPPTRVTDNDVFGLFDDLDVPHYFSPAIAATNDNRFIVAWQDFRSDGNTIFMNDIWRAERETDGASLIAPTQVTFAGNSVEPILNSLTGNDAILTYLSGLNVSYIVVNSSGILSAPQAIPGATSFAGADAVMLPNGSTAIAWTGLGSEVGYAMLDAAYNVAVPAVFATNPNSIDNRDMSVTFDSSNRVIMTWADEDGDIPTHLFYALANDTGSFITQPQTFLLSTIGIMDAIGVITSGNGQGNAPILLSEPPVLDVDIDIVPGSSVNTVSSKTLFVPVAILSADGFDAASDVDRSSLTFGKTGDEDSLFMCLSKGRDVNSDSRRDLICLFRFSVTGIAAGDTQAVLRGQTLAGAEFEGTDSVQVGRTPTK